MAIGELRSSLICLIISAGFSGRDCEYNYLFGSFECTGLAWEDEYLILEYQIAPLETIIDLNRIKSLILFQRVVEIGGRFLHDELGMFVIKENVEKII